MPRIPLPFAHWPRNAEDLETLDERMGGRTSMFIGSRPVLADGSEGKAEVIEWWIEFQQEFIPPGQPAPKVPADPMVKNFLKALAKRSAGAWISQAAKAKGW